MENGRHQAFDVYDAAVPIFYGFAELTNTATKTAPDMVYFNGSTASAPVQGEAVANIKRCGRWRVASIQVLPADSLITQQAFFCTIQAAGEDLNTGVMLLQSGVTYYPGTLLAGGSGFMQQIGVVCHNLSAAAHQNTYIQIGLVRTDTRPGTE